MGFRPTANPFKFERQVAKHLSIELDFLSEPEATLDRPALFMRFLKRY
jgi:hypothetical protein